METSEICLDHAESIDLCQETKTGNNMAFAEAECFYNL
jgi:hypothetical protein